MTTRDDFTRLLLARLGAPATPANVTFLGVWMAREATTAANNPLATTLNYGANTKFNSIGVRNYADLATGVEATARTLEHGYPRIVADLKAGKGDAAASETGELSKWSGGGYGTLNISGGPPNPVDIAGGIVNGVLDLPADTASAAKSAVTSLLGLDDLGKKVLAVGLAITFTVAALGLIGLGLFKLTGKDIGDVISAGGQATGAAGLAAAVI